MQQNHYQIIDIARGVAILMMFIYHFCFDLDYFHIVSFYFTTNPFWLTFRAIIVSSFLLVVGVSLALASSRKINKTRYWRRLLLLAVYASVTSIASYLMFPETVIFFGILHFILLASVVGLLFAKLYWTNLMLGIVFIILGGFFSFSYFNQAPLQWFGLMTYKPRTEDYVPFLPWFGVVLTGMFVGKYFFIKNNYQKLKNWSSDNTFAKMLEFGGRHSIHIYMLHQPIFMGLIYIVLLITGLFGF